MRSTVCNRLTQADRRRDALPTWQQRQPKYLSVELELSRKHCKANHFPNGSFKSLNYIMEGILQALKSYPIFFLTGCDGSKTSHFTINRLTPPGSMFPVNNIDGFSYNLGKQRCNSANAATSLKGYSPSSRTCLRL